MTRIKKNPVSEMEAARKALEDARAILKADVPGVAAERCYNAAFRAAQARIAVAKGDVPSKHKGVNLEIGDIYRDTDFAAQRLLSKLERWKLAADYGEGKLATNEQAAQAIVEAQSMIDRVSADIGEAGLQKGLTPDQMANLKRMRDQGIS